MATIVIKLDSKAYQSKLIEAIEMPKGVKSATFGSSLEIIALESLLKEKLSGSYTLVSGMRIPTKDSLNTFYFTD